MEQNFFNYVKILFSFNLNLKFYKIKMLQSI